LTVGNDNPSADLLPRKVSVPIASWKRSDGLADIPADGQDGLRGGDVVAGTPLVFF
jgi:hypothetical protein